MNLFNLQIQFGLYKKGEKMSGPRISKIVLFLTERFFVVVIIHIE